MSIVSTRRATAGAVAAVSLAFAGPAALAAQSASAAAPTPIEQRGLLDPIIGVVTGLTGALTSLLNPTALTNLNGLTGSLTGGGSATPTSLTPLTSLLTGLSGNGAIPLDTQTLLAQASSLTGAAGSNGSPIPVAFLQPLTGVLGLLGAQPGLSGGQLSALTGLQSALLGLISGATPAGAVGSLPIGSLPIDTSQLAGLTGVLGLLQGGTAPSGADLDPIAALLHQVATTAGLPAPVAEVIDSLSTQVGGATGVLPTNLVAPVGQLLRSVSATPGVPGPLGSLLDTLGGLLGTGTPAAGGGTGQNPGGGGTTLPPGDSSHTPGSPTAPGSLQPGANTPAGTGTGGSAARKTYRQPRLQSARYDTKRRRFVLTFSCPAGTQTCATLVWLTAGTRAVGTPFLSQIAPGARLVKTVGLDAASKRTLRRKALKVTVTAATSKAKFSIRKLTVKRTR